MKHWRKEETEKRRAWRPRSESQGEMFPHNPPQNTHTHTHTVSNIYVLHRIGVCQNIDTTIYRDTKH